MTEEWREVPGTNGMYEISIDTKEGKCRSWSNRHKGKMGAPYLLRNTISKKGRISWHLKVNGEYRKIQAAYWVAITYPELVQNDYFKGAEIDHIDTDRLNNHPSNLRWVDRNGQMNNPLTKVHLSESHRKPVIKMSLQGETICCYSSITEAAIENGICAQNISACCLGKKYKTAGGFIWKFA
ncbi:MAG: HNH endonuclease [Paludibacteraceae bacterium]|nr:HNH endonuclease [Paludibacteraceae bacterium]